MRPSGGSPIKDVRFVPTTFLPKSHQKSLYALSTSVVDAAPFWTVVGFDSRLSWFSAFFRSYSTASASVSTSFPAKSVGRWRGVSVRKSHTPWRSARPSAVLGTVCFPPEAFEVWPATDEAIANPIAQALTVMNRCDMSQLLNERVRTSVMASLRTVQPAGLAY